MTLISNWSEPGFSPGSGGSRLVNLGLAGHINVESGFGPWPEGEALLAELRADALRPPVGSPTTARAAPLTFAASEPV
jgi:hypothetical protein